MNPNEGKFQSSISQKEIEDFLLYKSLSPELKIRLTKIIDQDSSISKMEALEMLLDHEENTSN